MGQKIRTSDIYRSPKTTYELIWKEIEDKILLKYGTSIKADRLIKHML
jgi:hypothetical protein